MDGYLLGASNINGKIRFLPGFILISHAFHSYFELDQPSQRSGRSQEVIQVWYERNFCGTWYTTGQPTLQGTCTHPSACYLLTGCYWPVPRSKYNNQFQFHTSRYQLTACYSSMLTTVVNMQYLLRALLNTGGRAWTVLYFF